MSPVLEIEEIKKNIPQRFPFLMLDRVLEAGPQKVVAIKNVSVNEHFFAGHFPAQKVMPGVLIIEAMAQAGLILHKQKFNDNSVLFLTSVKARFHHPVFPGDQLKIEVVPVKMISTMGLFAATAGVEGKKAAEAEFGFATAEAKTVL